MSAITVAPRPAFWRAIKAMLLWGLLLPLLLWLGFALLNALEGDVREARLAPALGTTAQA
ncbi:hypothetical protein [Paucibacter soli]|uniref:hypothetical protein n=1 Tax=Paucibacter soli TaxID=3133433 RepID=UPI0030AD2373